MERVIVSIVFITIIVAIWFGLNGGETSTDPPQTQDQTTIQQPQQSTSKFNF